ncbi:hypothetical protein [Catellatospora tritici]|uniref:hypothetical protein n=1 Tax=Catellatospora tritici TaxID=2851566 RepID=UPI001C2D6D95|nr:hypothetical protein [Catellatospora tritici]MBV1856630.1 hypothetical protein [Catellatospora tritici]
MRDVACGPVRGFTEILGPGYPGDDDHTHTGNKSSQPPTKPCSTYTPKYLTAGFEQVRAAHGTFDGYLTDALGIGPAGPARAAHHSAGLTARRSGRPPVAVSVPMQRLRTPLNDHRGGERGPQRRPGGAESPGQVDPPLSQDQLVAILTGIASKITG